MAIKTEPYNTLFGIKPRIELGTYLPSEFLTKIKNEI